MGRYIACGIATEMVIEKEWKNDDNNEILKDLGKKVDLNLYEITEEEARIILTMKKEIFEKNAVDCILEQLKYCRQRQREEDEEKIKQLKDLKYDELMKIAEKKSICSFQLNKGNYYSSDISYLLENSRANIFCDMVFYVLDGKIILECWYDVFTYLRKCIINSSTSTIKTSLVVDIVG